MSNDLIPRQAVLDICEEIGQKREWLVASEEIAKAVGEVPYEAVTDEMVERAAREMWNDRDARHGGSWESRDPREVCITQTKATARAALTAALQPSEQGAVADGASK